MARLALCAVVLLVALARSVEAQVLSNAIAVRSTLSISPRNLGTLALIVLSHVTFSQNRGFNDASMPIANSAFY